MRKPVHLERPGGKGPRQRLWEQMRKLREFTMDDLSFKTNIDGESIRKYIQGLVKAGYLEKPPVERFAPSTYLLVRDNGVEAPRVDRTGRAVNTGLHREQMWRTMRIIRDFTASELAAQASTEQVPVSLITARKYLHALALAGYLREITPAHGPAAGRYALTPSRYTGPRPPIVQRTQAVYDPNEGRVVWQEGVNEDEL
ncbi:hypothetical protein [Andreprevotia chitinilytica]|uniref:hypothetical protein n=1 Tax=Andreprevotia chitinilytica TaxID=396808 RepID=UPI0005516DB8|nr:hypothetical protein [Andreprevotia chitinilytica]